VNEWLIIVMAGVGTFAIRLSWLAVARAGGIPAPLREALHYVTPAVIAAIIAPAVLYVGDTADLELNAIDNERIVAALAAGVIAWATRNVWLTIGVGMAALWALKALT
jgi:branched-subunit amino acid transport protein